MPRYRKRPVEIDAIHWTGHNLGAVLQFIDETKADTDVVEFNSASNPAESWINIHTLEGVMRADAGDWIIRGVKRELYPCKPDVFEQTYEPASTA
ncbi:hypothetical protein [Streptomyces sp. NPDC003720]|uniref:hypothetical protein n=1 Tax=Streptomyces sp. NPDC003720 TaxID=3364684 RepID=UPI00368927E6